MDNKRVSGVAIITSVLLHSLLAFLPWQEKSRPLVVSSTPANPSSPASPVSVVDASQLPTLPASESQPLPAELSSPSAPAPSVAPPADTPIPATNNSPINEPPPQPAPEADLPPDAIPATNYSPIGEPAPETASDANIVPTPTPSPVPSTPPPVTPTDEVKIAAELEHLADYFQAQDEGVFQESNPFQIFNIYAPEQVNQFFDENNQPKFNESSFSHLETKTPEQVLETVVRPEIRRNTDFDLQPQENFPAGQAYQLSQGEMVRYLIIVGLGDNGSFLMLSESLPGLEP
ncbi:MAG: hypothetical protein AAGE59_22755 [Cyanobacteria bacterium P01_F01_bin.86]